MATPAENLFEDRTQDVKTATERQAALDTQREKTGAAANAELAPMESAVNKEISGLSGIQPPKPTPLPEYQPKPPVDAKEYQQLSMGLIAMALIGGIASKGNWMGASASLNGALKGYMEGNKEAAERDYKDYQTKFKEAQAKSAAEQKEFEDILQNKRLSINDMLTQIKVAAAKYGRDDVRAEAEQKSIDGIWRRVETMDATIARITDADQRQRAGLDAAMDRKKATDAGGLDEKGLQSAVDQYRAGDTSAFTGLSKQDKARARNRLGDEDEIRGTTGADQAARNANFAGVKAGERTLGTRQANIDSAVTEAEKILPILRKASDAVQRSKSTNMNELIQIGERGTSDENLLRFSQAARSFANIYTRAVVPGASGVQDREESIKNLPTFTDQKSFNGVLDIMEQEMKAAKESPAAVREDMSRAITGRKPKENAEVPSAAAPTAHKPFADPAKEARYQEWKKTHASPE